MNVSVYFFISFGLCFVCFALRTLFNILYHKNNTFAKNRVVITAVQFIMFVLWFSWFFMCFNDPIKMKLPVWSKYIGLILFIVGVSFFILSHTRLKGFEDKGKLVTKGIYSKIRNPMYLGFILWVIGFPIFLHSLIAFLSAIIWVSHFMYWRKLEEQELEEKYESYREYKKKTWF